MNQTPGRRLLFVTGTDTGVGKTLLTSLLLSHLRRRQVPTLAVKPFCSGSRADARLLRDLQEGDLTLDEINPFFFPEPVAPLVAARRQKRPVRLAQVLAHIRSIARYLPQSEVDHLLKPQLPSILLIEGAGGILVPLGPDYFVLDLIRELKCEVIIVSRNQLGTLNHTLLTIKALTQACPHLHARRVPNHKNRRREELGHSCALRPKVVLMQQKRSDASSVSNLDVLAELVAPVRLWKLPYCVGNLRSPQVLQAIEKKFEKTLAQILD